ncbi:recombinase family protein [Nocardia brevicatena]|uniref:recombinase family protein n=1 Tax=Nocardia brevicatena TaxID=37327 RepID=UPI001FE1A2AD|nr:recombinase family protein [Nocardia brevicatena]
MSTCPVSGCLPSRSASPPRVSPCPSAYDRERNWHRCGVAWSKSAVRTILTNPRYTGSAVWNKQHKQESPIDVEDVALGHHTRLLECQPIVAVVVLLTERQPQPQIERQRHLELLQPAAAATPLLDENCSTCVVTDRSIPAWLQHAYQRSTTRRICCHRTEPYNSKPLPSRFVDAGDSRHLGAVWCVRSRASDDTHPLSDWWVSVSGVVCTDGRTRLR